MTKSLALLSIALILGTSCNNDLNIVMPGGEMCSVYGVLKPTDTIQKIRINKVFVTKGDAKEAAKITSMVNYNQGELKVVLERFIDKNGVYTQTTTTIGNATKKQIILNESVVTTAGGTFSNQQRIWTTNDKIFKTGDYKISIYKMPKDSLLAYASTTMIDSIFTYYNGTSSGGIGYQMPFIYIPNNPSYPEHGFYPAQPTSSDRYKYTDFSNFDSDVQINFVTSKNAKAYDLNLRLHYIDNYTDGTSAIHFIDLDFDYINVEDPSKIELIKGFNFNPFRFFSNLASKLSQTNSSNVKNRKVDYIETNLMACNNDLYMYFLVNTPSSTIAQDKPIYTNITNGVGVFACQTTSTTRKDLWGSFIDKIACHAITFPYKFCNFSTGTPAITICN